MGNGSGGYQAEPTRMLEYAQTVQHYAASFAEAAGAGTEVAGDNRITATVNGSSVELDGAFGLICQPGGIILQQIEQHANKALGATLEMLQTLSAKLTANADAYQGNEGEISKNLAAVHERVDQEQRRDKQGA